MLLIFDIWFHDAGNEKARRAFAVGGVGSRRAENILVIYFASKYILASTGTMGLVKKKRTRKKKNQ